MVKKALLGNVSDSDLRLLRVFRSVVACGGFAAESTLRSAADYCDAEGFRLSECVAYADASSDLPLFEVVGFPVAVNPETRLAAIARKRGWLVEEWKKAPGGARPLLPIGELMVERERRRTFA